MDVTHMPARDPHHLGRFIEAQADTYAQALEEIRAGRKQSHWMWFVFPQYAGLGHSPISKQYAIQSVAEAQAYLQHPVLEPRLVECCQAVLDVKGRTAREIFGTPDDLKLCSSATLFASLSSAGSVFHRVLDKHFAGRLDERTLSLMSGTSGEK